MKGGGTQGLQPVSPQQVSLLTPFTVSSSPSEFTVAKVLPPALSAPHYRFPAHGHSYIEIPREALHSQGEWIWFLRPSGAAAWVAVPLWEGGSWMLLERTRMQSIPYHLIPQYTLDHRWSWDLEWSLRKIHIAVSLAHHIGYCVSPNLPSSWLVEYD